MTQKTKGKENNEKFSEFKILQNVLDGIRFSSPRKYSLYKTKDNEKQKEARSKALVHFFLELNFGIFDFEEREKCVTDGARDGGIDGYYIDESKEILYLIQAKFPNTEETYSKSIQANDLIKIEVERVLDGKEADTKGTKFNKKILNFQTKWSEIDHHSKYKVKVILLANLTKKYSKDQVKRLIDDNDFEVFNYKKLYDDSLIPFLSGTHHLKDEVFLKFNFESNDKPELKKKIKTKFGNFDVYVIFAPLFEIGILMLENKNSILKYNPRSYLTLKNRINIGISNSIENNKTNEFALLNNGITMLSSGVSISKGTGTPKTKEIRIRNPQIINGAQTAYTIGELIKAGFNKKLKGKEVMIKVVELSYDDKIEKDFIFSISSATNQQTLVAEADRKSNEKIQKEIQSLIFKNYGCFYERKKGEFYNGQNRKCINKDLIIDRNTFVRSYYAFLGNASGARSYSTDKFFQDELFQKIFNNKNNYPFMFFSYLLFRGLSRAKNKEDFGNGIRYGRYAIISAVSLSKIREDDISVLKINKKILSCIDEMRKKWKRFETKISKSSKNKDYFEKDGFDFDNYYKGKTLDNDLKVYFGKKK